MRIGLIIYGSLHTVSGGYLYDRMLVEHLERAGDQVEVISLPARNYARHLADNFSASLLRRLAGSRLEALLQDELNHPSLLWLNRRLRKQARYPILTIVHHLRCSEARREPQNWLYRQIERAYLTSVDGFICNSQTTRAVVEGLAGGGRPAVVAYPGGDRPGVTLSPKAIEQRTGRAHPLRILFVGNLIPRKGLHVLIDALARIDPTRWRLTIIGDGQTNPRYTRAIARQIRQNGLARQIAHLGSLPADQLAKAYAEHHLLAVPSSYEGFGIVYVEGMACGLPAIAGAQGAAGELITDGVDGLLIQPGDSEGLAGHIQRLIGDRERLKAMSLAARRRFEAHPTWDESMAAVYDFLHRFDSQNRASPG